ncbi:MAG: aspartate kinase [Marinicaulis sp.]|nr:aspartate kinase [Marinicaulis sp.]
MARIVMKFGGTSVANIERIRAVSAFVRREIDAGHGVAVVVSAMAGETNRLIGLCADAGPPAPTLDARYIEHDTVVAAGEQISSGLLALVMQNLGYRARSWQGWQIPLKTSINHGEARISEISDSAIGEAMDGGEIAIVSGFQGIAPTGRISTLGRGGSDTSAVALAAAIGAARCDIYTDVDGVYTTDPRLSKQARRIAKISYEEMLEMASDGAKVLQTRSVEIAMAYKTPIRVLSSFDPPDAPGPGTTICDEDDIVEQNIVTAVTPDFNEASVTVLAVPDEPGRAARIFTRLAEAAINIDMIVQSASREHGFANISFTTKEDYLERALEVLNSDKEAIGFSSLQSDRNVTKVSVIGLGMKTHAGVAGTMFQTLADKGINIQNISTSEIKISVLINSDAAEYAVRALHDAYGLGSPAKPADENA